MGADRLPDNLDALRQETRELWEQIAPAWDENMGAEGGSSQTVLIGPATEKMLGIQPGERVLDGLEEPAFGHEYNSANALSWANFHEAPPVLITRWRLAK